MIDPGLSESREGVRVSMENSMRLNDELSGAEMPPHIRISDAARGHCKKTQGKDGHEDAPRLEKLRHQSEDNTLPAVPRYKIASPCRRSCFLGKSLSSPVEARI